MAQGTVANSTPHWPKCGASAVILKGRDVLLIVRGKGAYAGMWSLPGGHIEPGEAARDAALREVREETCIEAEITRVLDVHDVIIHGPDGVLTTHYVLAVYQGRWLSGEPCAASDSRDARFVAVDQLDGVDLTKGTRGLIARAVEIAADDDDDHQSRRG